MIPTLIAGILIGVVIGSVVTAWDWGHVCAECRVRRVVEDKHDQ